MSVRVMRAGLLTSLQDSGRYGLQHLGIVPCGAMDLVAHRIANALVGNPESNATLECTVIGPDLIIGHDALIALYGAAFEARIGDLPLPRNRPVFVKAGTTLSTGAARRGARAYLAIAGGFVVPEVLGSRSTYIPAGFGGLGGRAVKPGDRLPGVADLARLSALRFGRIARRGDTLERSSFRTARWSAPELTLPRGGGLAVRAMEGRHFLQFDSASRETLFSHTWRVSSDSNRMGYRLAGPPLTRLKQVEILSEPTCLGTVQVPNDGTPIALMADHQTTGGYPKIVEIASVDIPGLAQLSPGGSVQFVKCSLEEAESARRVAQERVRRLVQAIEWAYAA